MRGGSGADRLAGWLRVAVVLLASASLGVGLGVAADGTRVAWNALDGTGSAVAGAFHVDGVIHGDGGAGGIHGDGGDGADSGSGSARVLAGGSGGDGITASGGAARDVPAPGDLLSARGLLELAVQGLTPEAAQAIIDRATAAVSAYNRKILNQAVQIYTISRGHAPTRVEDLVPDFLDEVPRCPDAPTLRCDADWPIGGPPGGSPGGSPGAPPGGATPDSQPGRRVPDGTTPGGAPGWTVPSRPSAW